MGLDYYGRAGLHTQISLVEPVKRQEYVERTGGHVYGKHAGIASYVCAHQTVREHNEVRLEAMLELLRVVVTSEKSLARRITTSSLIMIR